MFQGRMESKESMEVILEKEWHRWSQTRDKSSHVRMRGLRDGWQHFSCSSIPDDKASSWLDMRLRVKSNWHDKERREDRKSNDPWVSMKYSWSWTWQWELGLHPRPLGLWRTNPWCQVFNHKTRRDRKWLVLSTEKNIKSIKKRLRHVLLTTHWGRGSLESVILSRDREWIIIDLELMT